MVLNPPARHPFLFYLWFEYMVPKALKKTGAGLFLSTDGYLSLNTQVPSIPVIHDLNFEHYPEHLPFLVRKYYKHYFPKFARRASRIATVSDFSKTDIAEYYKIDPNKIDVVYNGANETYHPISPGEMDLTRQKYAGGGPYFLFIGSLLPRKNIANLLLAFDIFKRENLNPVKLLIIGEKRRWADKINNAYNGMKHKKDVIFKGQTAPDELKMIIPSALAMVYVSFFEGFGIPIIEAMRSGTPVITSDVSCMPEIAGNAAMLTDPFSPKAIAECMKKISADNGIRKSLMEKGLSRAKDFSWDITANKLWDCILKTQ